MLILKKLEQEEVAHHSKGLILDPHHHHHHLHLYQQLLNSRQNQETQENQENQEIEIGFHGFHQNHHQLQQNQEIPSPNNHRVLHGGLGGPARQPPPRPQKKRPFLPSSVDQLQEYAPEKMGESYQYHNQQLQQHHQQQQQAASGSSRLGLRAAAGTGGGGEIVEVQGGHIVRSTGRKDRHSKVCTAKGPRDRRVRLSAHTAIQFYDVQDRLGYDRPSKAVDWLIKKAKAAIDELAELPAWKPTATISTSTTPNSTSIQDFEQNPDQQNHQLSHFEQHPDDNIVDTQMGNSQNSSFLPPSLDSDSIADTIKSFFPMGASSNPGSNNNNNSNNSNNNTSSGMQFHQSFPPPDLLSRTNSRSQDLRLSLQSFQDPILHHHHHHEQGNTTNNNSNIFFDGSGWPDNQQSGYQRMVTWGGVGGGDAVSAGFVFSSVPAAVAQPPAFLQPLFGQTTNNQYNSQRGPLQSSNAPSFRAWIDPPAPPYTGVAVDQHPTLAFHHPASMSGFASGLGGFSGFRIPARIQGDEEEHDGISDKPSSASSDSRH